MSDISTNGTKLPHINDDLIWKIFVKVEPKTVGRLKVVNKAWKYRLSTPLFIKQNWEKNKHRDKSVIIGIGYPPADQNSQWFVRVMADTGAQIQFSIPFNINGFWFYSLIGSDHGVLCVRVSPGGLNARLIIWNPLTRKTNFVTDEAIRHCSHAVSLYAFGFTHDSMEYRILHVYKKHIEKRRMSWALYNSIDADWVDSGTFESNVQKLGPKSIVNDEKAYWVGWDGVGYLNPVSICTFNLQQQQCYEGNIPDETKSTYHTLTHFKEGVGFISYHNIGFMKQMVVWGLKEDNNNMLVWDKFFKVSEIAIPHNPTLFVGKDILSIMELRCSSGGSNDTERTDILLTRLKFMSSTRDILLHQTWQERVYVKTITMYSEELYMV
ncbi:uncharacterized protein LOC127744890 [Arachis duranensis]|uniref:Uncharacterized protein LOC127744890 n=1 Tax=Arachis duranensis TaxID=130453 RepID=A0A9C6TGN9_ARADU|nr:uncharacterized protein LOC127744890 [Arachis duranensis]